jgi:BlaI family transcriptional regulator, penicillinase repressor
MVAPIPSDRELEILKALWKLGESSVRQVLDELAPNGELAFNTVQTQLRIMAEKWLVRHRARGRTFLYTPLYSREAASKRFLSKVYDGALQDLVLTLLRSQRLTSDELADLERLIADARKNAHKKRPKGTP